MNPETRITFDGVSQSVTDWALDYGITPKILIARLERGLSAAQAIKRPMVTLPGQRLPIFSPHQRRQSPPKKTAIRTGRTYTHGDMTLNLKQWAELLGMSSDTLRYRIRSGWDYADVFNTHRRASGPRPGVSSNFAASEGTGAGSTAQETFEITFSEKAN